MTTQPVEVDGRVRRGERNREAIVDAMLACYDDGVLRPSAAEIAQRAGVSARSLHNHFADMEGLRAEVAERQWQRHAHLWELPPTDLPLDARIDAFVSRRAELYEAITPVRRAALLSVHESPAIASRLASLQRMLRRQVEKLLAPELDRDAQRAELLDALDVASSWDTWNRLRTAQNCSAARAARVVVTTIERLLEGST